MIFIWMFDMILLQGFWDKVFCKYVVSLVKDQVVYEKIFVCVVEYLGFEDQVLEFGCGIGLMVLFLVGNVKCYLLIDFFLGMIQIVQEKFEVGLIIGDVLSNLLFLVVDVDDQCLLQYFGFGGFDVVLVFNFLYLVDQLVDVFVCIYKLFKFGGFYILKMVCFKCCRWLFGLLIGVM